MGSTATFSCVTAVLLLCSSSAAQALDSADEHDMEQREVTFDLDRIMQEMQTPESFMQKEMDLSDLLHSEDFAVEQKVVSPQKPVRCPGCPDAPQPGRFGPRSFPSLELYNVEFPLARPDPDNIGAVCLHGDRRPTYPDSYFPASGHGFARRQAAAVNNAESWFRSCCRRNQTQEEDVTLCCAVQAWELSMDTFCEDGSRVKDRQYQCCGLSRRQRAECVQREAANPKYQATLELPVEPAPSSVQFTFDPESCQRTLMTQVRLRGEEQRPRARPTIHINFPPGRPTLESIQSLCDKQKLRPRFSVKCLPHSGHEHLARQAKTVNRLEKGFKQCCKKKQGWLTCAEKKWRDELGGFCSRKGGPKVDHQCCAGADATARLDCFERLSPDPLYNLSAAAEETTPAHLCAAHKLVKKTFPVKSFVSKCCPLASEEQSRCILQTLEEKSGNMCSAKRGLPPAARRCCRLAPAEAPPCLSQQLLTAVAKATRVLAQKKKKICPIS